MGQVKYKKNYIAQISYFGLQWGVVYKAVDHTFLKTYVTSHGLGCSVRVPRHKRSRNLKVTHDGLTGVGAGDAITHIKITFLLNLYSCCINFRFA